MSSTALPQGIGGGQVAALAGEPMAWREPMVSSVYGPERRVVAEAAAAESSSHSGRSGASIAAAKGDRDHRPASGARDRGPADRRRVEEDPREYRDGSGSGPARPSCPEHEPRLIAATTTWEQACCARKLAGAVQFT